MLIKLQGFNEGERKASLSMMATGASNLYGKTTKEYGPVIARRIRAAAEAMEEHGLESIQFRSHGKRFRLAEGL